MADYQLKEQPIFVDGNCEDAFLHWHKMVTLYRTGLSKRLENITDSEIRSAEYNKFYFSIGIFSNDFFNEITNVISPENY